MQFLRFCGVGAVGFVADAGMTVALSSLAHLGPLAARVLAFVFAATITWHLNRIFTFKARGGLRSLVAYVLLTSMGAFINISIYSMWVRLMGVDPLQIVLGVALGSVVALVFNYGISRRVIFRKKRTQV